MKQISPNQVETEVVEYSDEHIILVDLGPRPDDKISVEFVGSELIVIVEQLDGTEKELTVNNVPDYFENVEISTSNGIITVTSPKEEPENDEESDE